MMDVRAIVIVGGAAEPDHEQFAGTHVSTIDVLGRPVLSRVIDRLRGRSVRSITVVGEVEPALSNLRRTVQDAQWVGVSGPMIWRHAQVVFADMAQAGAEVVLVIRLGAYAEVDYDNLIQFHIDSAARVTAVVTGNGELIDTFAISASRRNDAKFLLRSRLKSFRAGCSEYPMHGYFNPMRTHADFRQLAVDTFAGYTNIEPAGSQLKPGVWVGQGARVQRGARLLAPCYIGANAKVRANAVVARCSTIEHDAVIEVGTVVDGSSILPHSHIGKGLDLAHSVVGFKHVASLHRGVDVEISDSRLIGENSPAPIRTLRSAASLAVYLPAQLFKGLFGHETPVSIGEAVQSPSAALKQGAGLETQQRQEFSPELVVARRYGNQ